MMRRSCWVRSLTLFAMAWGVAQAMAQALPTGLWVAYDDAGLKAQALVRISEQQGQLVGHIVEVLDPEAKPDERCDKCPSDRKGQPLKGLRIIGNVDPVPKGTVWGSGVILDPDDGREYRLEMDWRSGAQELKLRGYWGPFWRTQVWRRPAGAG